MPKPTTLYSREGDTKEALAPSTTASQVAINDENGMASNVDAEIVLMRQRISAGLDAGVQFKGALTATSGLPTAGYKAGWQYIVKDAGTYAGKFCEVGDLVLCISDYADGSASNADWTVLKANNSAFTVQTDARTEPLAAGAPYTVPAYSVGTGALMVFLDGILCNAGVEYTELTSTTISFTSDIPLDIEITVRVLS